MASEESSKSMPTLLPPQQDQRSSAQTPDPEQSHLPQRTRSRARLPIRTYHCSFCKQILLGSTRDVARLPTRAGGGLDGAGILPLPGKMEMEEADVEEGEEGRDKDEDAYGGDAEMSGSGKRKGEKEKEKEQLHYTILLSTTAPSTQPTIIRRQDGFEKRFLIRCGRCRVVCGYALDRIHFPMKKDRDDGEDVEGDTGDGGAEVVYILPGAVVETGEMIRNTENKVDMAGWARWEDLVPS